LESLEEVWSGVCEYCRARITDVAFNVWISVIKLTRLQDNEAVLFVRTVFQRNIIIENYSALLVDAFHSALGFPVTLSFTTEQDISHKTLAEEENRLYEYTFDTFVVGGNNRFAHAAALAVADRPSTAYNPLFIFGNSGLGKTHLLHAICSRVNENYPEKKLLFVSGESFTNELIENLHITAAAMQAFREKYRTVDVFMVDDIQFIAGKESTQEEFFNTFNTLFSAHKQIILTSDRPPRDIKSLDERIRSRFESGLIADIQPPEFETRVGIVQRKASILGFQLEDDIVFYIADEIKSNIRQLEGVVKKLQAHTLLQQEPITIEVAQKAVRDIRNDSQKEPVTMERIVREVANTYGVNADDIRSKKRDSSISYARQVCMYIIREVIGSTVTEVGDFFSGRDHSTVVYACGQVENRMKNNIRETSVISDIIKNVRAD